MPESIGYQEAQEGREGISRREQVMKGMAAEINEVKMQIAKVQGEKEAGEREVKRLQAVNRVKTAKVEDIVERIKSVIDQD